MTSLDGLIDTQFCLCWRAFRYAVLNVMIHRLMNLVLTVPVDRLICIFDNDWITSGHCSQHVFVIVYNISL